MAKFQNLISGDFIYKLNVSMPILQKNMKPKIDISETKKIIKRHRSAKGALIPLLQEVQALYGYVPAESIDLISKELSLYPVKIYEVLTFYTQFRLTPSGRHTIRVCQGTACHVMGGKEILDYLSAQLRIKEGETTADALFSLERVACLGCCGMAPVIVIDDDFYGNCTIQKVSTLLKKYK
ncbi:MAG: NADH-quinone oxidoreductase subunit NuoE [bacterium]